MYKKMLVPLDGSRLAEVVFEYAGELAHRLDLELIFLHVCDPEESELAPMHRSYIKEMAAIASRESKDALDSALDKALEIRGELAIGKPAEEILRFADEHNVDLILMATHGHSGIDTWCMGSVAHRVLNASKIPIWLVPAVIPGEIVHDKWPTRSMLVPLDGSVMAESVLPHVEALARQRGADLVDVILLKVCEPVAILSDTIKAAMPRGWKRNATQQMVECQQTSEEYLSGVEKRLRDAGLKVQSVVIVGKPASAIIEYAQNHPFNLVTMSTHGHSGVTRWAYGSVADKVLHGISSPIFVVRPH